MKGPSQSFQLPAPSYQLVPNTRLMAPTRLEAGSWKLFSVFFSLLNIIQYGLQIEWQRRVELDPAAVGRMCERQPRGVKEGALEALDGTQMGTGPAVHADVR